MSTTITSLLNSLHTHLQSQTQLLPTLHTQLGLSPTALADDLATLQQQLTQCVEARIDTRRKEVDEWMQKCGDIEEECIRYSKALGNHGKVTGGSVGEIRKEQVLPRRFEMISEYQEKMRQLYHTKLEQLLTLTNRLSALGRTLGPEFYSADILEPTPTIGESEYNSNAQRDVTPERFSKLEKELVRGKAEVTKRLAQLSATLVQIDWLYTELGISHPPVEELPSTSQLLGVSTITRPTSACSNTSQSNTSDPFLSSSVMFSTPTPDPRARVVTPFLLVSSDRFGPLPDSEYERIFSRFVARIEELSDESLSGSNTPTIGLEGVEPSMGLISWAENKRAGLEDVKRRRETHIQAMYDQLEALWRRLGVSEQDMDAFVEAQRGSTELTVRAYEEELDRMLELKREKMSVFVENARAEITKLWDDLMVAQEERADFAPFADDEHTEELLSIHEEEIRRLKEERKLKGSLLTSIKKYFDICQDEKDLAAAAADQTRLLGRGPRDPGRLLREEKMRKRVTKEKPRLQQDLLSSVPIWEAETGRTFFVHGESILQLLINAAGTVEKENGSRSSTKRSKSQSRSGSAPARSRTPTNPIHNYVPRPGSSHGTTSNKIATTPATRPRSRSASTKRPRLGEATSTYNNVVPPVPAAGHPVLRSSRGAGTQRAPSPTKKVSVSTSLPRPVPLVAPVPRAGNQHSILGHGRAPSSQQKQQQPSHTYHPYPQTQRSSSRSTSSSQISVYGSAAFASSTRSAGAARKASRARRESFKPRPSTDGDWAGDTEGTKRWPGFAGGALTEEDDF